MNHPLISIIIPIYNMDKLLSRCVDSIIEQDNELLEIILINDGSSDLSGDLCDQYAEKDKRIKVVHKINGGVSDARNYGLDKATGEYISFVDPDDWVEPTTYNTLVEAIHKNKPDILRFKAYRNKQILNDLPFDGIYEDERLKNEFVLPMISSEKFGGMFILGVLWIHIYKRQIIENNNIRFNKHLYKGEDRLFSITVFLHSRKVLFMNNIFYHYEVYENSLSNKYDSNRWEQEILFLKQLKIECRSISESFFNQVSPRLKNEYLLRAITSIQHEFFSDNPNSFIQRYTIIKKIVNSEEVINSSKHIKKEKLRKKDEVIFWLVTHQNTLLLSFLETAILYFNLLKRKIKK